MPTLLIVNADDFGASHAVNAAVLKAHRHGVLTSASLMVTGNAAGEAVRVALGDYVIEIALSGEDLAGVLARELRWCRTIRVSNPYGHFGLVTTFGFAYAAFFWAATGFTVLGWLVMGAMLCLRTATAWLSARVFLGDREFVSRLYLLPARDLLVLGVWVAGYLSRCVTWRGRKLRLSADGKMTPVS